MKTLVSTIANLILVITLSSCEGKVSVPEIDLIGKNQSPIGYLRKNDHNDLYSYHDANCPVLDAYDIDCELKGEIPTLTFHCIRDESAVDGNRVTVDIEPSTDGYKVTVVISNLFGRYHESETHSILKIEPNDGPIAVPACSPNWEH